MPKKLGTNPKAVEARARKDEQKRVDQERSERAKEDAEWADDDKNLAKKQKRKEEMEKKAKELADRKAANKAAYDEEMGSVVVKEKRPEVKVTRAAIEANAVRQQLERERLEKQEVKVTPTEPLEENINRLQLEEDAARNIDEAIAVLGSKDTEIDRHPEKRLKAAYTAFEEIHLPRLKAENPNLRLSQLKQMLKKDWTKSPDNPLNKRLASLSNLE
jgi:DNA-binding transcriptional regulator WhiA